MAYPTGVHALLTIEHEDHEDVLEMALGPADTLGNLEDVVERFAQAYCLTIGAMAYSVDEMRICLFDPERFLVAFDENDDGSPSPDDAMSNRFAFAFVGQLDEAPSMLDPWMVVRPCIKQQVQAWYELMLMTGAKQVHSYCLDPQLSGFFQAGG